MTDLEKKIAAEDRAGKLEAIDADVAQQKSLIRMAMDELNRDVSKLINETMKRVEGSFSLKKEDH